MNFHAIGVVYRKELTEWLRDRRTLISTVLVPLLAFPILISGMISLSAVLIGGAKAKEETPKVMLRGGADSPEVVAGLKKLDKIEIVPETPNWKDQIIRTKEDPRRCRYSHGLPGCLSTKALQTPSRFITTKANSNRNLAQSMSKNL